jgi:excinuclease UvrABC ATPase subunit
LTPREALSVADSHDLIRVRGARENNLTDVSAEMLEQAAGGVHRRFSGWSRSSLAFGTTAAKSQRLINGDKALDLLCADLH